MSELRIPAGLSLREAAERLGVPLEELQRHAGGMDVEATATVERRIEVPDGFLRVVDRNRRAQYAAVPKTSARHRGANEVVTLDIEYRRTRVAGGVRRGKATPDELDAMVQADAIFDRLAADSNELAVALYHQLTRSQDVALRARAYARESLAESRRYLLYGEDPAASRVRAMSAAKGALMADPKLPEAHVALAQALEGTGGVEDLEEARVCLERAVGLGAAAPPAWTARARRQLLDGEREAALRSAEQAVQLGPDDPLALEAVASGAFVAGDLGRCRDALERAGAARPTYANVWARLAHVLRRQGSAAAADQAHASAKEQVTTEAHGAFVETLAQHFPI